MQARFPVPLTCGFCGLREGPKVIGLTVPLRAQKPLVRAFWLVNALPPDPGRVIGFVAQMEHAASLAFQAALFSE